MSTAKCYEIDTPSGKKTLYASGPIEPVDVDELIQQRNAWLERNKHLLEGYTVNQFLREKHADVEKGLL